MSRGFKIVIAGLWLSVLLLWVTLPRLARRSDSPLQPPAATAAQIAEHPTWTPTLPPVPPPPTATPPGVATSTFTPLPPHREIEKTALGATATVPWDHAPEAVAAVRQLQARGYRVLAVEQTLQATPLTDLAHPPGGPLALVFGNELHGVGDAVIEACDGCLSIPQQGAKHSLNVSVCAGVVLWWFAGR
ncbi:MAG: hypothetical protein HUU33_15940 [Flavobacteriales bacterium]|nr:hypothetical protein [Flavobacteriales bacterium]